MRLLNLSVLFFFLISVPEPSEGFSILTHEAVIDTAWDKAILPTLRMKFPGQSDSDYMKAKAFVYGGAIMPDMGFFPFGSIFFTNLVHYVRSGDFVQALIDEAQNLNEYAFALGALAHYNADNYGHPLGVNLAVAMTYPDDRKKFGDTIPYEKNSMNHRRMEFAFDVLQVARGNYQKENYTAFYGFEVSKPVLERAFLKTYGVELGSVFGNIDLALSSFRFFVHNIFPPLTKAAWANKKDEIQKLNPDVTGENFQYISKRQEYRKLYGKTPVGVRIIATVIWIMPKMIGPSRALRFKIPTKEAELKFFACFDSVEVHYTESLSNLRNGNLKLRNLDYDTGRPSQFCEYALADDCYGKLLAKQKHDHFSKVTPQMCKSIVEFYGTGEGSHTDSTSITALYEAVDKDKVPCNHCCH